MRYDVKFLCYNGMTVPLLENAEAGEVREYVRRKVRALRETDHSVERLLEPSEVFQFQWEVQLGGDYAVGDTDGYLVVKPLRKAERRW